MLIIIILAAYAVVCVQNKTQISQTIHQQLSPTWDETLIFDDIMLVGPASDLNITSPRISIELYHKGPQVVGAYNHLKINPTAHIIYITCTFMLLV